MLAAHGYWVSDAAIRAAQGLRFAESYSRFALAAPLPPLDVIWRDYSQLLYASYDARLAVFGEAVGTARRLQADGVPLAVATSSQRERLTVPMAPGSADYTEGAMLSSLLARCLKVLENSREDVVGERV